MKPGLAKAIGDLMDAAEVMCMRVHQGIDGYCHADVYLTLNGHHFTWSAPVCRDGLLGLCQSIVDDMTPYIDRRLVGLMSCWVQFVFFERFDLSLMD